MDKILIFIIFLGPLVFFHELGHFLFARLFGVKVEVFSIGFGPKIFKWVRKETQYAISLIPLGGYVKMFGDDPLKKDELSVEERKLAFTHKSKWARFWIVFGGPLANFILALVLYAGLLMSGEKVPEPRFGYISEGTPYYEMGLRTADVLKSINESEVLSFDDLNLTDSKITTIGIERAGKILSLNVETDTKTFLSNFAAVAGRLRSSIVVDKAGEKFFLSSSLGNLDTKLSLDETLLLSNHFYLIPVSISDNHEFEFKTDEAKELNLENSSVKDLIKSGHYPLDLVVSSIVMGSPADKAQIKKDDILLTSRGVELINFEDLRGSLKGLKEGEEISLTLLRKGEVKTFTLTPDVNEVGGVSVFTVGVYSGIDFIPNQMVETTKLGLIDALIKGTERTWDGIVKTLVGFKMLISGEVSASNIGGPLAIGKVASDSFYISLSMFFRLMALISINLGIINLFPIPVLDGGHILFIIFEIFNRGPLSQKKIQVAQQFGLSLLFVLIFVALFNDITRLF